MAELVTREEAFAAALAAHQDTPLERGFRATPQSVGFFEAGFNAGAVWAAGRSGESEVEAVASEMWPHLWDGTLERSLAKITPLFTAEQAAESAEKKREEKRAVVRRFLATAAKIGLGS